MERTCDRSVISQLIFSEPTQVKFHLESDEPDHRPIWGIGIENCVVCLCCGAVNPVEEVDYIAINTDKWIDMNKTQS